MLKVLEGRFAVRGPGKGDAFLGESKQGRRGLWEPCYKASVEVGKSNKGLYVFQVTGSLLFQDSLYFTGVYTDPFRGYDEAQVGNFVNMKLAFLNVKLESRLFRGF